MKSTKPHYFVPIAALLCFAAFAAAESPAASDVFVGINQSNVLENEAGVKRISIATPEVAEAVAVSKTEVLINGKTPGDTTLILWDLAGKRAMFNIHVTVDDVRPDTVRDELKRELAGQDVTFELSNGAVFLRGVANDVTSANRAATIVSTLGKVVNLLNVKVPEAEPQILLKVRFANIDRSAAQQLGLNLFSTGATNTIGAISTGQFGTQPTLVTTGSQTQATVTDLLNIFLFRRDLNLGAVIQALESKQVVEILAEPNLLTVSGRPASFLAGGEFPYPTLQGGGSGIGQITIQFREFGVRIHFRPVITPRGTIRLMVTPEVSSLDFANGLTVSGYTVPGLAVRRIETEVELENEQSFVIAGLLDNRTTENLSKIPGLSNIPLLGKLFESRSVQKSNSELLVLVTPEIVRPIPEGVKAPDLAMPKPFLKDTPSAAPQNPADKTGKLPVVKTIPLEVLEGWSEPEPAENSAPANSGNNAKPQLDPVKSTPAQNPAPGKAN